MKIPWFINKDFTSLEIKRIKSSPEHEVERSLIINDASIIQSLADRIEKIPADGDEMISFSKNVEQIKLLFHSNDEVQEIHFFAKKIKTPSTGFNSEKNKFELDLYSDIDGLLSPGFNKRILLIENLEVNFDDFSIIYVGTEFHDYAPVTIAISKMKFLLKDKHRKEQMIEITSGQRPPQPLSIKMNNSEITILTYETEKKERLYPNYFQIKEA